MWSGYSNIGLRRTLDAALSFAGVGTPVYLRVQSADAVAAAQDEFAQFGFQASASGATVTEDVQIVPTPSVVPVTLRDIGLNAAQLSFGSVRMTVSHSWVEAQQQANGYLEPQTGLPDFYRVFRDAGVVGIYYSERLGKIVSVVHNDVGGVPITWDLVVDFAEEPSQG